MTAKKKKELEKDDAGITRSGKILREDAEEQLAKSPAFGALKDQNPEQMLHELRVHQIELDMQAEQLMVSHLALEDSRDKYLDLYEFAPLAYLTLNDKALVTGVNLTCATLLLVERDEIINHGLGRFIADGDDEIWDRYFAEIRQHKEKQSCTLTLKRGDGSTFPARLEGACTIASDGTIAVRIVISDITDIWQIEALRESENRYRAIYDQSPIAIELYDAAGKLVHANPACLNLFGIEDIEVIRNFSLFADPNISDEQKENLQKGKTVQYQGPFDFNKVKSLNLYPTSREGIIWLDVLITPLGDRIDSITGFLVQIQDITVRTSTEKILHESETKHRALFNAIADTVFLIDQNSGNILDVNLTASRFYGYSRDEFIKMNAADVSAEPEQTARALKKPTSHIPLRYHHRKDGTIFPVELTASTFELEGKTTIIATARDITDRKRVDEVLHDAAHYTRSLIEANLDPLVVISPEGKVNDVNAATEQVTGYSRDHLIGTDFSDYFTDQEKAKMGYLKVFDEGVVRDYPLEIRHRNGKITSVLYNATIYRDESGIVQGIFAAARDITDRKRAEELIQTSETRYRRLFEAAQDGILILNRTTGEIIDSNPFIEILTGYTKEELVGKPLWEIGFIKDQALSRIAFEELQTKEYIRYEDLPLETKNGGRIEVEFVSNVYPIDPHTSVIQCNIRDITDRKLAEELIQTSETRYRRLFEAAQDGILILNRTTGKIIDSNPFIEILTGYTKEELVGKPLWEIGFIKDQALSRIAFEELQTKEYIRYEDLPLETKDGRRIDVEFVSNVYPIDSHTSVIQCNIRDITDRKQIEDALQISSKKLNLLSSITRHDINNQLTVLQGYLHILEKKQPDPSFSEYFQKISTAAQRISSMILFTKEYEQIGVNTPVWQDCCTLADTAAKQVSLGPVLVKNDLPIGAEVFADPLIVKVCYNLMDNAVRYGGKITTIRFSVERSVDCHLIVCEDDGDGVIAEEKEKIFERGFGKNTGLGLALAREILDITGITIRENGEPGVGARFEIVVPKGAYRSSGKEDRCQ